MRTGRAAEAGLWGFATLALFHRVVLDGAVVLGRDALRVSIPLYDWWAQRVRAGEFPQWYPLDAFGQPYVGMLVSAPFHPTHLLALAMPTAWAVTLMVLVSLPLAAGGAAALARRFGVEGTAALLAGAAWGFCGAVLSLHDNPQFLLGAATGPWALAFLADFLETGGPGRAARAAAVWALCLFSGDAQTFVLVGVALGLLTAWKRAWGRGAVAAGLTALLAAPQLWPTWLAGAQTTRGTLSQAELEQWSTHPLRLFELLGGPLFDSPLGTEAGKAISRTLLSSGLSTLWSSSLAIAPAAVVLAGFAAWQHRHSREGRAWMAIAALLLWLSLGKHLGASWLLARLPVLHSFRYPEKWFLWFSLAVAIGAAHGLQRARPDPLRKAFAVAAALALGGTLTAAAWTQPYAAVAANAVPAFAVSFAVLAVCAFAARHPRLPWVAIAGVLVCALPSARMLQLGPASALDTARGFTHALPDVTPPQRVFRLMGKLGSAYGDPARLTGAFVDTFEPVARGVEAASTYLPGRTAHADALVESPRWLDRRLFELASVRYLSVSDPDLGPSPLPSVARLPDWGVSLLEARDALPRAYVAQPVCVGAMTPQLLARPDFDRHTQVLLECSGTSPPAQGTVAWKQYSPELRLLEVQTAGPAAVVLVDAWAEGWEARLDGEPVPLARANVAFQAVRVPEGVHHLALRYRTPGLFAGIAGFGVGLCLLGGWGWRRRR